MNKSKPAGFSIKVNSPILMAIKGVITFFVLLVAYIVISFSSFLNPSPVEILKEKILAEGDWKASQIEFKDFQYQYRLVGSDASANLTILSTEEAGENIDAYIEVTHSVFTGWELKAFKKGDEVDS